jgi:hypothetical protein
MTVCDQASRFSVESHVPALEWHASRQQVLGFDAGMGTKGRGSKSANFG